MREGELKIKRKIIEKGQEKTKEKKERKEYHLPLS